VTLGEAVVNTLSEQRRSTNSRGYRKVKRADDELRTRGRIVDAAETLHGTLGPARASVSAIADAAGVTRATVYRHFPDEEGLFLACSGQWLSRQRLPDPESWGLSGDPWVSLRTGLLDLYRYFRGGQAMLALVERDVEVVPSRIRDARLERERVWRETLLGPLPGRRVGLRHLAVAVRRPGALRRRRRRPDGGNDAGRGREVTGARFAR
jgi:AcrR family transcriptional regulator